MNSNMRTWGNTLTPAMRQDIYSRYHQGSSFGNTARRKEAMRVAADHSQSWNIINHHGTTSTLNRPSPIRSTQRCIQPEDDTCSICYTQFDDRQHKAVWTSCGHANTCIECVFNIILSSVGISVEVSYLITAHMFEHSIVITMPLAPEQGTRWAGRTKVGERLAYTCPVRCEGPTFEVTWDSVTQRMMVWLDEPDFRSVPSSVPVEWPDLAE